MAYTWCTVAHGEHLWSICHSVPLNTEVTLEFFSAQDSINCCWSLEIDTIYHSNSNSNDLTHFLSTPQARPCGWSSELFIAPPVPLHICLSSGEFPPLLWPDSSCCLSSWQDCVEFIPHHICGFYFRADFLLVLSEYLIFSKQPFKA